jgi:hypothetical protein
VYSAALTDIRQRVHVLLGAQQPTFAEFLFILQAAQVYAPSLFPNNHSEGQLAVATLAAWHTQLINVLTDVMKLANNSQEFADGYWPLFALKLRDAEPSTFDPVAVAKDLFSEVTVKLVSKRQKEVMNLAFSGGQSQQHHSQDQSGGKGSGGKGKWHAGDGIRRTIRFLEKMECTLLTGHRRVPPFGLAGGEPGQIGENWARRKDGRMEKLKGCDDTVIDAGEAIIIQTPTAGGYGRA